MSAGAYTIGTAARVTGVPAWKLRAWEASGLLRPRRSRSGYRVYQSTDLDEIARLRDAVDRVGSLGAHVLAATGEAPASDASGPSSPRGLTEAVRACLDVSGASWGGLLWREHDRPVGLLATAGGEGPRPGRLEPADDRAWMGVIMGGAPVDGLPDLHGLRGGELVALRLQLGGQRGALVLRDAVLPLDDRVRELLTWVVLARLEVRTAATAAEEAQRLGDAARRLEEAVAEHDRLDELLEAAVGIFLEVASCDSAEVTLTDRTGRRLVRQVARGVSPRFLEGCRDFRSDEGLAGRALQSRRPVFSRDLRTDPRVTRHAVREEGLRSYLSLPLVHRGRAIGVLQLGSRSGGLDEGCDELLSLAGRLAAAVDALDLARQLADERHKRAVAVRTWAARLNGVAGAGVAGTAAAEGDDVAALARRTAEAVDAELEIEVDTGGWHGPVRDPLAIHLSTAVRALVEAATLDGARSLQLRFVRRGALTVVGQYPRHDPLVRPVTPGLTAPWTVSQQLSPEHVVTVATYVEVGGDRAAALTPREVEILQLFGESHSTHEVAALLGVSTKTVCNRLTPMYVKLGVSGRTQAVTEAIRRGLVHVA